MPYEATLISGRGTELNSWGVRGPDGAVESSMHWGKKEAERIASLYNGVERKAVAADRARIRRELLEEITKAGALYAQESFPAQAVEYLEQALNRIIPE